MDFIACILLLLVTTALAFLDPESRPKKCFESKIYKMRGFFCNHLDLEEVPKNIKPTIEVVDLQHNYITFLNSDSFASCPTVKYIYLQYNSIANITEGTFSYLLQLEVLDLSKNVLRRVPAEIFELPLLRNLYLERSIIDSHAFEDISNPIKAPLQKLNLADNNLNKIPKEIGILPQLLHLNISSNRMHELTPQQFSPFCSLTEVDLNFTLMNKCACVDVLEFLIRNRNISISSGICKVRAEECERMYYNETDDYENCVTSFQQLMEEKKTKGSLRTASIIGIAFLVLFTVFIFVVLRLNTRRTSPQRTSPPIYGSPYYNNFTHNPIVKESDV